MQTVEAVCENEQITEKVIDVELIELTVEQLADVGGGTTYVLY